MLKKGSVHMYIKCISSGCFYFDIGFSTIGTRNVKKGSLHISMQTNLKFYFVWDISALDTSTHL